MTTLREHLEAIRDWHSGDASELGARTVATAEAALAILDASERASTWFNGENIEDLRLVPDASPDPQDTT